jgi:hypothetical protein
MRALVRMLAAAAAAPASLGAMSEKPRDPAGDSEIRIGYLMPYTGPLSAYASDQANACDGCEFCRPNKARDAQNRGARQLQVGFHCLMIRS